MCKLARETMGYQNFGVQVTSFERRVERSCGIQSTYAVRPCISMSQPYLLCHAFSLIFSGLRSQGAMQHRSLMGVREAV
jgi:hypothetical protein